MYRGHPEITATIRLLEDYAIITQRAMAVLDDEQTTLDWHPAGSNDGTPRGSPDSSPVERALERKLTIEAERAQLDDDRRTIAALVHSALFVARRIAARAEQVKQEVKLCDGRPFQGADLEWIPHSRHTNNGWYDRNCREAADESGLCPRCRIRERRWREAHNLAPRLTNAATPAA